MLDVQIENTLAKTVNDLLCNPSTKASPINLSNLTSYIQAAVLFDKVKLPARPARTFLPTGVIPPQLRSEGIFEVEVVEDFATRMQKAQDETLALVERSIQILPVRRTRRPPKAKGRLLVDYINQKLSAQESRWREVFWSDVEAIIGGKSGYEQEGVQKVLGHFEEPDFSGLSDVEKVGIYYLWRCFYNVQLAVDNQRIYLQNLARSPLAIPVYELLRKSIIRSPVLIDCPLSLKAWVIDNMSPGTPPKSWVRMLPTLLHTVLKSAHGERGRIADAILDLRESKKAVAFRKHFRKVRENTSTAGVLQKMDEDIEHLFYLWSKISESGRELGAIATPFLKRDISDVAKALGDTILIPYLAVRCRHLRLFWLGAHNSKKMNRELAGLIIKTFGEPVG